MSLQQTAWTLADTTGSLETISIDGTTTTIAGVTYGVDGSGAPLAVQVSADGKSFQIKVINGINQLSVTLISTSPNSDPVHLQQGTGTGAVLLDSLVVDAQQPAIWDPMIEGT